MAELNFATSDAEAAERAAKFLKSDPFPSIPMSLLSSAEIDDYARATSLLYPFDSRGLKTASYEVHIGGEFTYWNGEGRRIDQAVTKGSPCVFPANSVSFIQLEPYFRVPYYLALRYNLRTTHLHRGLLLGSGPLVDPGFSGKVLVPIHNLTATDYDLDTNEALVWVEFAKTSFGHKPTESEASAKRYFVGFPPTKLNLSADAYLRKANAGNPIRSSIPTAMAEARSSAREAASWARNLALGALAGIAITVLGLAIALFTYLGQVHALTQNAQAAVEGVNSRIDNIAKDIGQIDRKLAESSLSVEGRIGDDFEKRLELVKADLDKRLGSVETEYTSGVNAMKTTAESHEERLGVIQAELLRLRGIVEKKK
jgi:deoxycytidine triphosphate deaminase